jgi:hypothetical protein
MIFSLISDFKRIAIENRWSDRDGTVNKITIPQVIEPSRTVLLTVFQASPAGLLPKILVLRVHSPERTSLISQIPVGVSWLFSSDTETDG